jgi:AraC-like DNA-binding protein
MEHVMALRIFDHLLADHSWTTTGRIYTPATHVHARALTDEISDTQRAEIERRSMLARLTYRSRLDPIMSRAARLLQADSCLPIQQLAAALRVSEKYLLGGLRSALGENPRHWERRGTL